MKNCPFCDKEIPKAAIFCRYCKNDLRTEAVLSMGGSSLSIENQAPVSAWWYVIAVLIPLAGIIGGAVYASKPATNDNGKNLFVVSIALSVIYLIVIAILF